MINNEERIERFGLTCTFNGKHYFRGHEYVDLGLPSGTLWAKCNLCAKKETDFGQHFQFGQFKLYKETFKDYVTMDNDTVDAIWHNGWKTPTKEQFEELVENTIGEWTSINDIKGYKFICKNDKSKYVFFPAGGYCSNGSVHDVGSYGNYWSSSVNSSNVQYAYSLFFNSSLVHCQYNGNRCNGFAVRGVLGE